MLQEEGGGGGVSKLGSPPPPPPPDSLGGVDDADAFGAVSVGHRIRPVLIALSLAGAFL
jgi:hypothetical protein